MRQYKTITNAARREIFDQRPYLSVRPAQDGASVTFAGRRLVTLPDWTHAVIAIRKARRTVAERYPSLPSLTMPALPRRRRPKAIRAVTAPDQLSLFAA